MILKQYWDQLGSCSLYTFQPQTSSRTHKAHEKNRSIAISITSSKRPSARAQRACESPAAIVQSRRLAANDALAYLALLLLSVLVLRSFLFSDALAPLLRPAVLDAPLSLALPVP